MRRSWPAANTSTSATTVTNSYNSAEAMKQRNEDREEKEQMIQTVKRHEESVKAKPTKEQILARVKNLEYELPVLNYSELGPQFGE